jgi:uncharacterized protein
MKRSKGLVLDLRQFGEGTTTLAERIKLGELEVSWPGIHFDPELEVSLVVSRSGHDFDIALRFAGEEEAECDRCLKPFRRPIAGALRILGRKSSPAHPLSGQDGVVFHDGHELDLTPELREALLVDIPIQSVCREDCQGLCPTCGIDRNHEVCRCAPEQFDPRWAALGRVPPREP